MKDKHQRDKTGYKVAIEQHWDKVRKTAVHHTHAIP